MSEPIRLQSPLVRFDLQPRQQPAPPATITAAERAFLGHLNLRGDPSNPEFSDAVARVLGASLPLEPNTVVEHDALVILWLAPDEWLVLTPAEREVALAGDLRNALAGVFCAVTQLGGGQTVLRLEGSAVRDVLARGCTLDLHPRAFGPGRCAQTLLGKAPVLVRLVNETPCLELVVRRSFAEYVWCYLADAARDEAFDVVRELS